MQKYDAIIIGAGPAGLMAGRALNKKNIKFLIIDSKKEIGKPLRCGEGIRENEFLKFFKHKNYDFVKNTVNDHVIYFDNVKKELNFPNLELNRHKFEKWLAKPIKNKIKLKTNCIDIEIIKDYAKVITNKETYITKLVILCNGPNFRFQKKFGMIEKKVKIVPCYGGIYKGKFDKSKCYYYFDKKYSGIGYFWIFPKNEKEANIGFGALNLKGKNIKNILNNFLEEKNLKLKQKSEYSGIVPVSGPIEKSYYNRLMVCGSAAGHVIADNGEGIYFALQGGKLAGETAIKALKANRFDKEFLKTYEICWKNLFGKDMKSAVIMLELGLLTHKLGVTKYGFYLLSERILEEKSLNGDLPLWIKIIWRITKILKLT